MRHFIFVTNDGGTTDDTGSAVENAQVLGWADGHNAQDAFNNLIYELRENEVSLEFERCDAQEILRGERDEDFICGTFDVRNRDKSLEDD